MVRNHPTVGQIDIFLELNSHQLWIDLHYRAQQPIAHPVAVVVMVA